MRLLTHGDADLFTYLDVTDEIVYDNEKSSPNEIPLTNHTKVNRGLRRGHLPLDIVFDFFISSRKTTKGLEFELELRASTRKRTILYTLLGEDDVNVTFSRLNLYIPFTKPSLGIQMLFNEAIMNSFTLLCET